MRPQRAGAPDRRGRLPVDAAGRSEVVAGLHGHRVEAAQLPVLARVEGTPVIPALGQRLALGDPLRRNVVDRPGDAEALARQPGLVGVHARLVPLRPEVVLDTRVVRDGRALDERRLDVAVQVVGPGWEPLADDIDRSKRLRLRLRDVVAVEVEPVAVRARSRDAAVRVLDHVEDEHGVVEPRVHLRVIPIRRRGEPLDRPHHRVDALVLVAVDTALDEDRHLHVAALDQLLCPARIALRQLDDLPQARVAVALSVRVERVDRDLVHVVTAGGRADHVDLHAPLAAARDVLERAADRVVRNVREASGRVRGVGAVGQVLRGVRHRCAAPRWLDLGARTARSHERADDRRD